MFKHNKRTEPIGVREKEENILASVINNSPKNERDDKINAKIREKYSQDMVESIYRKAILGTDLEQFKEYNAYVEACKAEVDAEIASQQNNIENGSV